MSRGQRNHTSTERRRSYREQQRLIREGLLALGFEQVYEVGGCIRDELSGLEPKDIDIVVCGLDYRALVDKLASAGRVEPNIVGGGKIVGARVIGPDGEVERVPLDEHRHSSYADLADELSGRMGGEQRLEPWIEGAGRLVGCRLRSPWTPAEGIEISLARTERSTAPGRAHFEVMVDPSLTIHDDLGRRDYTVNAIARSLIDDHLVDPFNGQQDIRTRTLRVLGEASYAEDPSRILRGLVRMVKDGYQPDEGTAALMRAYAGQLVAEPREQIRDELLKTIAAPHAAEALSFALGNGLLTGEAVLPELTDLDLVEELAIVSYLCNRNAPLSARLAALLHSLGPEGARRVANRLLFPNELKDEIVLLAREYSFDDDQHPTPEKARRFVRRIGRDHVDVLLTLREAVAPVAANFHSLVNEAKRAALYPKELVVRGERAVELGFRGPAVGAALNELVELVIVDQEQNREEPLMAHLRARAAREGLEVER